MKILIFTVRYKETQNMENLQDKIQAIHNKIEILLLRQTNLNSEIETLKKEVEILKNQDIKSAVSTKIIEKEENKKQESIPPKPLYNNSGKIVLDSKSNSYQKATNFIPGINNQWEKFIGENLMNKIGILITVIGVTIGAKYAIDHQLISPLTRISLGYIMGVVLMAFAFKLKKNYENFSAVLLSGAFAILYIITYMAYDFYSLISQEFAFVLMFIFTVSTVFFSWQYNKQIIALLGLVGSYAIPFLLSNGSGNIVFLLSYVLIINLGILTIAFLKEWKWVNGSAFVFTWLIYATIHFSYYYKEPFIAKLFVFLVAYFSVFYISFLAYKLLKSKTFDALDVLFLLINSFLFFGFGYSLWNETKPWSEMLGLFTLVNAIVHGIISFITYRQKSYDQNMLRLLIGMSLVFISLSIPVQLNGNWVTILWILEASVLFWIGRKNQTLFYEKISYPLIILSFLSLVEDWSSFKIKDYTYPIFNTTFLTSIIFITAIGSIIYLNKKEALSHSTEQNHTYKFSLFNLFDMLFILVLYLTFRLEINWYFEHLYNLSQTQSPETLYNLFDSNLLSYKCIWIINYSIVFSLGILLGAKYYVKNSLFEFLSYTFINLSVFVFLTQGLYLLNDIQNDYYSQDLVSYFYRGTFLIALRYVSFGIIAVVFWVLYKFYISTSKDKNIPLAFELLMHITLLWILSNELVENLKHSGVTEIYKSGLSILWGIYSFILIIYGMWKKKKKHLRIGGIILFGITLIKLIFYDLSHLETIPKTIVLVLLGVLLLIISFLYTKYQKFLSDEDHS